VRGFLGVTDYDWYRFLRSQERLREVNFWRPSATGAFGALARGEPFFFKLKAPHDAIAGFGLFDRYSACPLWFAWAAFGVANGAPDLRTTRALIARNRAGGAAVSDDHPIGCVVVTEAVFLEPAAWVTPPRDWSRNIVRGKAYDLERGEGLRVWRECLERAHAVLPEFVAEGGAPRFGRGRVVHPRLGQGGFRLAVADAYGKACAVTTEHSLPVLEAAHIRRYSDGGAHEVRNGILLRSDVHRLFDGGYVTVTPEYRFQVSDELRDSWQNGRAYYQLRGQPIAVPASPADRPDRALLAWHNEHKFRG